MAYDETRTKLLVGDCPACGEAIYVVAAIEFGMLTTKPDGTAQASGAVTGAKVLDHDCLPRPTPREQQPPPAMRPRDLIGRM